MSLRDIQQAAGGRLWDYPDGGPDQSRHQGVADELLRMAAGMDPRDVAEGRGPRALVVDEYAGPVDEHGVGAHAYTLTVRMNPDTGEFRIEVSDPGAEIRRGFPPDAPAELRAVSAILFDGQGKAVPPSGSDPRVRPTDDRPIYGRDGEIAGRRSDETPKQFRARMRAEMADMQSRREAEQARRLRDLVDRIDDSDLPEGVTKRSLRLRASQAEWHAREHRKNADTWWRVAGGRPADDAPIPPRSPSDPAPDPARSRAGSNPPEPTRIRPGDRDPAAQDETRRASDPVPPRDADDVPEPGDRRVAPLDRNGSVDEDTAQPQRARTLDETPDFLGESDEAEHRSEHGAGDDVPAGMYRDADGLLHKLGDPPDSYRDPDGTWHHRDDAPDTYRDDTFRLRDALNNEFLPDHLTKRPYRFLADPGPEDSYAVVDEVIAGRIAKVVAERATIQSQRDTANDAVKRHMAEFGIKKISDLAEEKLQPRVQALETAILESSLSDAEKLAKLDRLAEMERNAAEFNRLGPLLVNASKTLGELGGKAFALDADERPGAVLLSPFVGAIDGADTVDIAVLVPGVDGGPPKLVVIEAKGVGSQLGGSKVAEAQQGSPEYLRRTAAIDKNLRRILTETPEQMLARGVDPDSAEGRALLRAREELLAAHRDGTLEIEYHLVHVAKNGDVTVSEFNLERDGVLVRIDVIGTIESPALVRTPNQMPPAAAPARDANAAAPARDANAAAPARDANAAAPARDADPAPDADESALPPQDGDSDAAAARDAELLGVPGEDDWSRLNPGEVGARLQEHLRIEMRNPDFEVFGFDLPGLDPEVVREYARAMVDLVDRFPSADLRSIGIGGLPPQVIGMAQPRLDASGRMFTESIILSYDHATGAQTFRDRMQLGVDNGRFSPEVLRRPVRAVVAHEYGHALDYASQQSARHRAEEYLYQRYRDDGTRPPDLGFEDWLHQLSGHSFDRDGNLRPEEALPEAFADHVLRGDDDGPASAPARALHDLLTRLAAAPPDTGDAPLSLEPDHVDLPSDGRNGPPRATPAPDEPEGGPEPGDRKFAPSARNDSDDEAAKPPQTSAADGGSNKPPADPPARTPDEPDDGANNRDESAANEPYQVQVWPPPEQGGDSTDRTNGDEPSNEDGARQPGDVAAATEWANREYDRMLAERHRLTREMEFWQAKRDDRITRLMDVADPERALGTRESLADTMRRLDEAATRRTVDIAPLGEDAGRQVSEQRSAADRTRRLRDLNKLEEAAQHVIQLRERIAVVDSQLRELVRDGAVEGRPLLAETLTEQHRAAAERARELLRIKPRRGMRDDLAQRLGSVDEQGMVDEAALGPDRLAETVERLGADHPDRSGEIGMLDEVAREVNEAHNRIGRIQDRMAQLAGAGHRDIEAAGGRMETDWVGVVDGDPPRIIVYGPREPLAPSADRRMSDHDLALQHALHTSEAVVRAMMRPDVTVEYRRVTSNRVGDWTIDGDLAGPQLRHVGGSFGARDRGTPPRGLDMAMWRAANGEWQQVDPSRPDWQQNRRGVAEHDYKDRDLPEGVSSWAVDQIQATVHDWLADPPPPDPTPRGPNSPPPPEPVNQDLLPHIVGGGSPVNPNSVPTYEMPFADAISQVMRVIIETAKLSGFTWFADRDNPGRLRPGFKGHPWFRAPKSEHQPFVRPVEADDVTDDRGTPEQLRDRARQRREDWARVQRWTDEQYQRFLGDADDVDRIAERVREQHQRERDAAAREVIDVLRRRVLPHAALDPTGDLDAQLARLRDAIDVADSVLERQFDGPLDTEQRRRILGDVVDMMVEGADADALRAALNDHMRTRTPDLTADDLRQIKKLLMEDELLMLDPDTGQLEWRQLDRLAHVAEAWGRLADGDPLPEDFRLVTDAHAWSELARRFREESDYNVTWHEIYEAVARLEGPHWDDRRPPLSDWRADIPYAPPLPAHLADGTRPESSAAQRPPGAEPVRDPVLEGMLTELEATVERMRQMDAEWEAATRPGPKPPDESGVRPDSDAESLPRDTTLDGMLANLEATVERMRQMDAEARAALDPVPGTGVDEPEGSGFQRDPDAEPVRDQVLEGMLTELEATVERMRRMDAEWEAADHRPESPESPESPDESGVRPDSDAAPVSRDTALDGMLANLEATVERMRRLDAEWAAAEAARDQARRTDSAPRNEPGEDGPEAAGGVRPSGPPSDPPSTPGRAADEPSTPDQARRPDGSRRPDPDGPIGERPDFLGGPDGSLGRNGDVLFEGNLPEGGTPLYRGIPRLLPDGSVNPAYAKAVSGRAVPRGTVSLSAEEHIGQRRAAESDTTSWSRTRSSAEAFTNGDGVILEWRTGLPPEGASWKFKPIFDLPDQFAQVLIQGTLSDARATRYLSEDANPEPVAQQNADQQTSDAATPHRTPDADSAAHARDVELLGAPAGDEWSRLSAAEVGERLREHLRQVTGNPEFEVFGFDAHGVHPEVVREFARAMVDMADRFPNADLRSVGLGELPPKVIGAAQPRVDPVTGRVFTESIVLSSDYARSAEGFRERIREGVERYGHSPTTLRRAVYAAVVHEYGHALDHAGQQTARHRVEDAYLAGRYGEEWLGQLSGHSFDREGMLRPAEALAESFAEVELRKALAADALRGLRPLGAAELELHELLARSTENPPEPGHRPDASEPDYSGPETTPLPGDSDATLLGAPADDEWSRLSPAEVGQKLRDDLRRMTDNPEFEVTGFDRDGLNAEVLREYARSMVDMFQKYPQADLRRIVIEDLPHDVFASTTRRADTSNLRVYADELLINAHYAASATEFRNAVDADSASGWLHPGVTRRPVYAVAVHEFGHVLDFSSSSYAQRKLDAALLRHYMSDRLGEPTTEGYLNWLKDNLSGYSLEESGLLNPREALAEAFADVELRGRDAVSEPVRVAYDLLREALDRSARRGRIGHFLDGFRLAIDTVRNAPDAAERHAIRSDPEQPRNEIGARTDDPVAPGDRHGPAPVARDVAAERPDSAEQQVIRPDAEQPGDADDPRREADSPLDEPDRRVQEPGARDLVRPDEGQPAGWQYRPIDVAAAEVREVLARSEIGRQALTRLRDLGAAIRFEEPGDGPGLPDGFDGRTMEVFIGTRGRDQLAQAAAVVRAAELARAVVEGRLEVTPARIRELDRADHVAARVRVEAEALGRQAEFHREMREAGYDPHGGPQRDLIDAAQRSALESVYLDAFDATGGVDRTDGPPVDQPSRQAIRDAEAARLTARRDAVAAEIDAARARRAEAMRGLASEADVRTRVALTDTLEQLHGRTTRVDQLRAWQDRLAELERAALRVIDLEEVLAGADAQLRHMLDAGAVARRPDLEQRRAAGVDELLADPRFDARADARDGSSGRHEAGVDELPADLRLDARDGLSARHEAGEEWDAAHRPRTPEEYAPSDLATARELERLQRAESAARRELTRIEADWDRAFRRLKNAYNLPDDEIPSTRQEILDLFRERSERIDIWNGTSYVLLLAELTAQHARVSADRARLLGEITDVVTRDLSDRAARAGDPPPTGIRVHLDESGVPQILRDSADVPATDARTDPPRRPAEETYPLTITEHAGTMLDRALRALHGSDLGKWAADLLDRLGVDIRFTTESEASIVRLDGGRYGLRPAAGYDPVTDTVVLESDGGADRHAAELIRAARLAEQVSEAAGEPLARLAMSRDEYVDLMLDRMAEAYALMYAGNADFTGKIDLNRIGVDDLERAYAKAYDDALKYAEKTYWKSGVVRSFPLYHRAAFRAGVRAVREHLNNLGPMVDWRSYGDHFGAAWDRAHGIAPTEPVGTDAPAIREDTPARIAERSRHVALEIESLRMLRDLGEYVPVSPAERAYTEAYDKAYTKADKAHRRNPAAPPPEEVAYQAGREAVRRYLDRVGLEQAEIALDVVRAAGNHGESRWGHPKAPEDGIAQDSDRTPNHEIERAADPDLARRVLDQEFDSHPHPERLTDRVARYPDYSEPGSRPRLVVVAEPGQHVDALRELALSHPELADVLWDRSHYLDYRNAVVGAGGLPTMHHITVTAAEGPYRHPSPDEAETQMLAHYLRYRADGLTHLGFDEWIKQLGPNAFYSAEDAKQARGTRRQGWHVEGRLVDGFLEAGYRTAAEADPPLGPPHPAEIAHRLYTRQIPLPGDTGIRRPAHHQLEVFKVGTTHFGIYLEADGNGGWRVPAPVSTGSDADVLATHLQGLAAPDRKKLVARIIEMLNDGSADLTDRSQPRNRFGRFIDRLTPGRSGTPEDDSGDRSTDEGDHPRVDRDRMADESGRAARPPEDIAPDVTDADVLGVPGADEWSHLSPHEVGERLQDRLREAMGNPEFEVFGFDLPGLDPDVVREYARAMVDMYARFPHVDLRSVGIGDLRRGELGYADGAIDEVTKAVYTKAIVLSYDHATSARDFRAAVYNAIGNDQFKPMMLLRPVYATVVHEYGHALDHHGNLAARHRAQSHLLDLAAADPDADFGQWLRELSGYSLDDDGLLDDHEAVAEAFAEVVIRDMLDDLGPAGKPVRALHDLLLEHARDPVELGRDAEAPANDRLVLDDPVDQVRDLLGQTEFGKQILASLDHGPTRTRFEDLAQDGRTGEFRRRELAALAFTAGNSQVRQALTLAHESLHAQRYLQRTTANTPEHIRTMSREEFVDAMIDEEAAATGRHFRLARELRALGYEIAEHPLEQRYNEVFDQVIENLGQDKPWIRTEAHDHGVAVLRDSIGQVEWNNGQTYAGYYGNAWDEANTARDGAAELGRHRPLSPVTADGLWQSALHRQDARLRAREAAEEFARRAEAVLGEGSGDLTRADIERALREAEADLDTTTRVDHGAELLRRQHDLRVLADLADLRDQAEAGLEGRRHSLAALAARDVLGAVVRGESGARVLTDHVAYVPGEPDRLVIAAEPGDYQRVTREAERDPFAAALLGRDGVDRRYLAVETDDFGRVQVRSVEAPDSAASHEPVADVTPRDLSGTAAAERTARIRAEMARTELGREVDQALTAHQVTIEYRSGAPDRYYPAQRRLVLDPGLSDTDQMRALLRAGVHADLAHEPDMPNAARLRTQSSRRRYIAVMLDLETAAHLMEFAAIRQLRAVLHDIPETQLERAYTDAFDAAREAAATAEPDATPERLDDLAREAAFDVVRPLMDTQLVSPDQTYAEFYGDAWDDANGHRSFDRVVQDAIASGEAEATVLREGDSPHSARWVELVRFANGTELIRKTVVNPRHAVAEVLTSVLGRAIEAPVPESVLDPHDPTVVYQQVMPGEPAADRHSGILDPHELGYAGSVPGRALGLLDTLVRIPDRDSLGWLAGPDRGIAGIDHSRSYENSDEARAAISPFAEGFLVRDGDGTVRYRDNPMTREAVDILVDRVAALRPRFERYGRGGWHDLVMERLAQVREHARDVGPVGGGGPAPVINPQGGGPAQLRGGAPRPAAQPRRVNQ
uniref:hypothetical protein n=1 Tax=Nocardia abscessus TaxID=120957 RepID=UPI0024552B2E